MIKTINILHVISDFRRGGRERQLAILTKFSSDNFKHNIATLNDSVDSYIGEYNIKQPFRLGASKIGRIFKLISLCRQLEINLIHAWGNSEALYSIPASVILGIPLLNGSIRHGIRKNNFNHRFRSIVLQNSKYVLGNSFAGFSANKIKINSERNFVLYNGIEDKFFVDISSSKREELKIQKKLNDESIIFISIANFVPFKDYFTTLQTLQKLKSENIDFHYLIIGKGRMENEIKEKIKELNLQENISLFNNNPNIPELLTVSDIMIHSSLGEGCSNAILEAKAAGLLVVASDTGGTKEILSEIDFLFEYKNVSDLQSKLKDAVTSVKTSSMKRQEIQSKTKERFSVNKMQQNYSQIVRTILSNQNN